MERTRNVLLQLGTLVLCINGALWFKDSLGGEEAQGPAVVLFRLGVVLFGLLLLGGAGVLTLVVHFDRSARRPLNRPVDEFADDELFE